ncbi:MAG TPA: hypothetical protein VI873_04930 [Candidatus Peribacteraceae bacterium]|nr:hypothetical protein [Candidatus Peribacteraceae bacterium]
MRIEGSGKIFLPQGVKKEHTVSADLTIKFQDFLPVKNAQLEIIMAEQRILREIYESICTKFVPEILSRVRMNSSLPPGLETYHDLKLKDIKWALDTKSLAVAVQMKIIMHIQANAKVNAAQAFKRSSPGVAAAFGKWVFIALREKFHMPKPVEHQIFREFDDEMNLTKFEVKVDTGNNQN